MQGEKTSRLVTKTFGWLAEQRLPQPILKFLIKKYAAAFDVETDAYDFDLNKAKSFQDFFLRKFKDGQRKFTGSVAAPAEGFITASGALRHGELMQVKGSNYSIHTLLSEKGFQEGSFATIYLGLGDYHHVHMPFDGAVEKVKTVQGSFFATNEKALRQKEKVYCLNERLVFRGNTGRGKFIMVLVGATCVGKIRLTCAKLLNREFPVEIKQGESLAAFEMGSTVVLIMDNHKLANLEKRKGQRIFLGEKIAD